MFAYRFRMFASNSRMFAYHCIHLLYHSLQLPYHTITLLHHTVREQYHSVRNGEIGTQQSTHGSKALNDERRRAYCRRSQPKPSVRHPTDSRVPRFLSPRNGVFAVELGKTPFRGDKKGGQKRKSRKANNAAPETLEIGITRRRQAIAAASYCGSLTIF